MKEDVKIANIARFIITTLKPFRWWIVGLCVVSIAWAVDLSLRPYLVKIIIERLSLSNSESVLSNLFPLISLYILASALVVGVMRFNDFFWLKINAPLEKHIGLILMNRTMQHSQALFQDYYAGSLLNRIKDVKKGVPELLKILIDQFFSQPLAIIMAVTTLWTINYKFALALLIWVIIFISVTLVLAKQAKNLSQETAEAESNVIGQFLDIITNIISVCLFVRKNSESVRITKSLDEYVSIRQRRDWYFLFMLAFQGLSFLIYQGLCLVWLLYGFKEGIVTAGDFALILGVNTSMVIALGRFTVEVTKLSAIVGNLAQGLRIVMSPLEIENHSSASPIKIKKGEIIIENLRFHYKKSNPLFNHLTVRIPACQKIGLVGYSGSGKTTFIKLLLRLHDIDEGKILIDRQNISEITQESLRENISMIPQDPSLFHRSILDNIKYGREDASYEEIIEASKIAHAHEFIIQLPEGYQTIVGEQSTKLSGGQRQRIVIARAVLKNAPILLLDEATSQLDSLTENKIQHSLQYLMEGKTTIIIAHRLSTLQSMDRILVFDAGQVVEDGTHEELYIRKGLYRAMWDSQVGGFLPNMRSQA